ncbi:MAG: Rne/Rng family ribonuclease [Polyangiaceae bacterium]
MSKNTLVISCDIRETRVALIEDGIIAELHIERRGHARTGGSTGDVYLGKVTRVLPGLQAAFIDIGLERAAFLHVEDLIRPDDFDSYLAGGRKHARGEGGVSNDEGVSEADVDETPDAEGDVPAAAPSVAAPLESTALPVSGPEADGDDDDDDDAPEMDDAPTQVFRGSVDSLAPPSRPPARRIAKAPVAEAAEAAEAEAPAPSAVALAELATDGDDDEGLTVVRAPKAPSATTLPDLPEAASEVDVARAADADGRDADDEEDAEGDGDDAEGSGDDFDMPDMPGFTVTDPNDPMPKAVAKRDGGGDRRGGGTRGRRGRGRGRGRGGDEKGGREGGRSRGRDGGRDGGREGRGSRGKDGKGLPGRISKSTPIREVVKEGQEIIVQITKEPIGTKGARCSSHISLPGRYVVYLPTVDHIGVSKRIGSERERARLREAIETVKPPTGGLIVRTVAEGLTKKQLKTDVGYLVRLWGEIAKKQENVKAPASLSSELDLVLKTARDLFTDEVDEVVIDDRNQYERLVNFVEMFMPERKKDIHYYTGDEPIFDEYGIEDEIARALSRKVPLPSGGHLIIDQAEALTAIDVNTGRFVGKGSKDMEETILKTNLEAVHEIAYQLRFRNIGGLIILDLIDMEKSSNREKVRRVLEELLQKDKAKTTLNRISDLGLIEMTRKRTRESLGRLLHEPCFYCDGTGQLQSKETIAFEILREIRRRRGDLPGYTIVANCHPAVADVLSGSEKEALVDAENKYMRKISVTPRKEYHLEQFDLQGK